MLALVTPPLVTTSASFSLVLVVRLLQVQGVKKKNAVVSHLERILTGQEFIGLCYFQRSSNFLQILEPRKEIS